MNGVLTRPVSGFTALITNGAASEPLSIILGIARRILMRSLWDYSKTLSPETDYSNFTLKISMYVLGRVWNPPLRYVTTLRRCVIFFVPLQLQKIMSMSSPAEEIWAILREVAEFKPAVW